MAGQGAVERHFDTAEQFVVGDGFGEEVVGAGVETVVDVDASAAGREIRTGIPRVDSVSLIRWHIS